MAQEESIRSISIKNGNLPLILASREDELSFRKQNTSFALQQQALKIARAMQTTLDVYTLIQRFFTELQSQTSIQSIHYNNADSNHKLNVGIKNEHAITYNMATEEMSLGKLTFTMKQPFTHEENITLENALSSIIYPLRNALLYHIAIVNSNTDPLTKLGNRAGFDSSLEREINFASRHKASLSLMVLDIDKFKSINDKFGHRIGDCLLKEVAKVLQDVCRTSDMIYRYGGDEFVVILSHTPKIGAQNLAERIKNEISKIKETYIQDSISITTSIGLACFKQTDTIASLFDRADKALYSAKQEGRNQVYTAN